MKKQYFLLSALSLSSLLYISCFPDVLFVQALPPDIEALTVVPIEYQGQYLCESDSSIMHVESNLVFVESYNQFITTIDEVQETQECSILAGGLFLPGRQQCIPIEIINGDTIIGSIYDIDTLFSFKEDEILKSHKGRLFLNYRNDASHWSTFVITPQVDGTLLWTLIDVPDDSDKIEEITNDYTPYVKSNRRIKYILNPTLKEFESILNKDYTDFCDILVPIQIIRTQ